MHSSLPLGRPSRLAKKMFMLMHQPDLETMLDAEAWAQGLTLLTDDHKEGVQAFFEKRRPNFRGM